MAKKQCVIRQYDSYRDPETLKNLDGKRTVSENIADLTGIKLAYSAYKRWDSSFNDTRRNLIGMNFTPNQLFWIAMAQNWCAIYRDGMHEHSIRFTTIYVFLLAYKYFHDIYYYYCFRRGNGEKNFW